MNKYTATSNGVEVPLDATNLTDAQQEAREWASYGAGVTIWDNKQPLCTMDFIEGGFIGDGQGSRTWHHGPWVMC